MSMNLYVGNLSGNTDDNDLEKLFGQCGTVESASVISDHNTGGSHGFGFVRMSSKSEGVRAVHELNGTELNGQPLRVTRAQPRIDQEDSRSRSRARTF